MAQGVRRSERLSSIDQAPPRPLRPRRPGKTRANVRGYAPQLSASAIPCAALTHKRPGKSMRRRRRCF